MRLEVGARQKQPLPPQHALVPRRAPVLARPPVEDLRGLGEGAAVLRVNHAPVIALLAARHERRDRCAAVGRERERLELVERGVGHDWVGEKVVGRLSGSSYFAAFLSFPLSPVDGGDGKAHVVRERGAHAAEHERLER